MPQTDFSSDLQAIGSIDAVPVILSMVKHLTDQGFSVFITSWKKPGADWEKWFCRVCGSPVPGENDPKTMFAPAGCLTEGAEALDDRTQGVPTFGAAARATT